jgi:phosphoglycolate phosphatase
MAGMMDLLLSCSKPRFGGFGSDFCSGNTTESWRDRGELVRIAAKRAEESQSGDSFLLSW